MPAEDANQGELTMGYKISYLPDGMLVAELGQDTLGETVASLVGGNPALAVPCYVERSRSRSTCMSHSTRETTTTVAVA
jgi:hypothetical protein